MLDFGIPDWDDTDEQIKEMIENSLNFSSISQAELLAQQTSSKTAKRKTKTKKKNISTPESLGKASCGNDLKKSSLESENSKLKKKGKKLKGKDFADTTSCDIDLEKSGEPPENSDELMKNRINKKKKKSVNKYAHLGQRSKQDAFNSRDFSSSVGNVCESKLNDVRKKVESISPENVSSSSQDPDGNVVGGVSKASARKRNFSDTLSTDEAQSKSRSASAEDKSEEETGNVKKKRKFAHDADGDSLVEKSGKTKTSKNKKKLDKRKTVSPSEVGKDEDSPAMAPYFGQRESKAAAVMETRATNKKQGLQKLPFDICKLRAVLTAAKTSKQETPKEESEETALENMDKVGKNVSKTGGKKTKCVEKRDEADDVKKSFHDGLMEQLNAARFRLINEQLYTSTSKDAANLFRDDKEAFVVYHEGFQSQVKKWPSNPVETMIKYIKNRGANVVVADFGCGEAKIAQSLSGNKVHSFDLVALNKYVTVCDIRHVPLGNGSIDVAVFCLSLMGTNLAEFLCEANRVLKIGGVLLIAEVISRFEKISSFVKKLQKLGFSLTQKDQSNKMFVWFEFKKTGPLPNVAKRPTIELGPCVYKKR